MDALRASIGTESKKKPAAASTKVRERAAPSCAQEKNRTLTGSGRAPFNFPASLAGEVLAKRA